MRSKKLTALGLSACMVFSTICVPVIEAGAAEELESGELSDDTLEALEGIEETDDAFSEGDGEVIEIEANAEGIYTVTITSSNLFYDSGLAENSPWIVTEEEAANAEMARDDLDPFIGGEEYAFAFEEDAGLDAPEYMDDGTVSEEETDLGEFALPSDGEVFDDIAAEESDPGDMAIEEEVSDPGDLVIPEEEFDSGDMVIEEEVSDPGNMEIAADEFDPGNMEIPEEEFDPDDMVIEEDAGAFIEEYGEADVEEAELMAEDVESYSIPEGRSIAVSELLRELYPEDESRQVSNVDTVKVAAETELEGVEILRVTEDAEEHDWTVETVLPEDAFADISGREAKLEVTYHDGTVVLIGIRITGLKEAEGTAEAETETAEAGDEKESLANVVREDISVYFAMPQINEEGTGLIFETREAEVTDFAQKEDGSIELTFVGESLDDLVMSVYTIHFETISGYAMAVVVPADNGVEVEEVDYEAAAAEVADTYEPSFSEEDISLPEGTFMDDGDLFVTDAAPDVVQEVLVGSGIAEEEMARVPGEEDEDEEEAENAADAGNNAAGGNGNDNGPGDATLEYLKEFNARKKSYENYDALAMYVPEVLGEINPTAGKVASFGSDTYRICKGIMTNNWGSAIQGTLGVLKMFGLFKGSGDTGVSNEKILSEVQKVGLEVSDMHCLTKEMNKIANVTLTELYAQGIKSFDTALTALNANAEIAQQMLTQGTILAEERGIYVPGENATPEEEFEFNYQLIRLIKGEVAKGGPDAAPFEGFEHTMENVIDEFVHVAGDVAQTAEFNPVTCYDKYWNMYFNYDTQGYYLRQSYRSTIEYELKRAFGLIEIYRNIFAPMTKGTYAKYNEMFVAAIDQLNSMPAGTSPEQIGGFYGDVDYPRIVHCNTFDKDVRGRIGGCCAIGNNIASGLMDEYVRRLHGRTVDEDLLLAGLLTKDSSDFNKDWTGLAFNAKKEGSKFFADVIKQDGTIKTKDYTAAYNVGSQPFYIVYYYRWLVFVGDPDQKTTF